MLRAALIPFMTHDESAISAKNTLDITDILYDDTEFDQIPWEMALVTVTPALARRWLENQNDNNRTISQVHTRKLANSLIEGTFQTTPQGISFTAEGKLLDGQHRLRAILKTGISLEMAVFFGVSARSFVVFDSVQKGRSLADIVKIAGISDSYTAPVGKAYKLLQNWEAGRLDTGSLASMTNDQLVAAHDKHPELVSLVIDAHKMARATKISVQGIAVARYLIERDRPDIDSGPFWDGLLTGADMGAAHPVLALRNWALGRGQGKAKSVQDQTEWVKIILKSWVSWVEKRDILQLKLVKDERRPDITVAGGVYTPAQASITEVRIIDLIKSHLLPVGSILKSEGTLYQASATVLPDGRLEYLDATYETPNDAGAAVRGGSTLGWTFWHAESGGTPKSLADLRHLYVAQKIVEDNRNAQQNK